MEEQIVSTFYPKNFFGNASCPLDSFFGVVFEAERVDTVEKSKYPASLTELSDKTADTLKRYMSAAVEGLAIAQVTHELLPILWVLDEAGLVHFALEEVYDKKSDGRKYPLARGMRVPKGFYKLGHPSLLRGDVKKARIGGELIFDPDPENDIQGWVITNSSGRFGYGSDRSERHLKNVADVFDAFGIFVDFFFIPPLA